MHQDTPRGGSDTTERPAVDRQPRASAGCEDELTLQERERTRMAYDLHDGAAQQVSAALLQVRLLEGASPEDLRAGLAELTAMLSATLDDLYDLIEQLHSRSIDRDGLVEKIEAQMAEFAKRTDIAKRLTVTGSGEGYSQSLQIAVFRIVQEALSNVAQHSGAANVAVVLDLSEDRVGCSVEDDGCGFDPAAVGRDDDSRGSYGLAGMKERAAILGGTCDIVTKPEGGTKVTVSLPVWRG